MTAPQNSFAGLAIQNNYSEVVLCTDGSAGMTPALQMAQRLAAGLHVDLRLLHAMTGKGDHADLVRNEAAQQAKEFGAGLDTIEAADEVMWDAAVPLVDSLSKRPGSLPVVASHARRGPGEALFGSVAAKVLRALHRPVAIMGPEGKPSTAEFRRIVACIDGSDLSLTAVRVAAELARGIDVPLWLIMVVDPLDESVSILPGVARDLKLVGVEAHWETLRHAHPHRAIVDYAASDPATITVAATQGRSGWRDLVMGSTVTNIVRHAAGVVVTVQPERQSSQG